MPLNRFRAAGWTNWQPPLILALFLALAVGLGACNGAFAGESDASNFTPEAPPTPAPTLDPSLLPAFVGGRGGAYVERRIEPHTIMPDRPRLEIIKYLVQQGDTLFGIAGRFGLKPESVLWANWDTLEQDPHTLKPGQELNIPPVDGVIYAWKEGDSLQDVANFFHIEPQAILEWPGNDIAFNVDLENPGIEPGTLIVIPGGRRDPPSWQMVSITRNNPAAASILGPGFCGSIYTGLIGDGFFGWPTSSTWISGYNYVPGLHEAIDIGGSIGNAIYAADDGVVVYSGWNNHGYGWTIVIDHGNGWQTLYAHLDTIKRGCGESVFQGNLIGTMGSSGNSTGPHLHFEMRSDIWGRVNPLNFLP